MTSIRGILVLLHGSERDDRAARMIEERRPGAAGPVRDAVRPRVSVPPLAAARRLLDRAITQERSSWCSSTAAAATLVILILNRIRHIEIELDTRCHQLGF